MRDKDASSDKDASHAGEQAWVGTNPLVAHAIWTGYDWTHQTTTYALQTLRETLASNAGTLDIKR